MNIYNSVRNVQGVFIFLDQWLVVAEHDWLSDLQEAIDDVDNVAAVTPGWNRNQTTLQLINVSNHDNHTTWWRHVMKIV